MNLHFNLDCQARHHRPCKLCMCHFRIKSLTDIAAVTKERGVYHMTSSILRAILNGCNFEKTAYYLSNLFSDPTCKLKTHTNVKNTPSSAK